MVQLISGCKINLFLRVGDKLPTGYHNLETLFVPLPTPCDTLDIDTRPTGIEVLCQHPRVDPHNNTLVKAYETYTSLRPLLEGLCVSLHKEVPLGGGLGGGSANAAVLLQYMQTRPAQNNLPPLPDDSLLSLAKAIGADVPFFLTEGSQLASGIGEKLTPCANPFHGYFLVLVCPAISISTAWAFKELSAYREKNRKKSGNFLTCSDHRCNTSSSRTWSFQNDFEQVVFEAYPELKRIKESLLENGAEIALLSGTGSSMFGIFKKTDFAKKYMDKTSYSVYLVSL